MKRIILPMVLALGLVFNFTHENTVRAAETAKAAAAQKQLLPLVKLQMPKTEAAINGGLRGAFAGVVGNQLLLAGGNGYKNNSFSGKESPAYSKAVYGAVVNEKTKRLAWKKLGELPEAIANGASVVTQEAMYLIGGENDSGVKASVTKLTLKDNALQVETIAYLPVVVKDCGAAIIDSKLHVIGGVQNGVVSNNHFVLDLKNIKEDWKVLPACPDSPRRLPVVAAQKDGKGSPKLYIWGGYVPKQGEQPVELSCEGYSYDPQKRSWKLLPSPLDKDLARIYLGSGKLLPLGDHQLVAVGGAGYKVLRQFLLQPASDYYSHPADWYGYNNQVFVYDTLANKWECRGELATEGVALNTGAVLGRQVFIIGGENKPGVGVSTIAKLNIQ